MEIIHLKTINTSMVGKVIDGVRGTLVNLYEQKRGVKDGKPWAMQNGVLIQEGVKMKVCFANRDELPLSLRGQDCIIESKVTNHGYQGVKVSINEYPPGTKNLELRITGSAIINFPAAANDPNGEPEEPFTGNQGEEEPYNAPKSAPAKNLGHPGKPLDCKELVMKMKALYRICYRAAKSFSDEEKAGLSEGTIKDIATHFSITAQQRGYLDKMQESDLEDDDIQF